MVCLGGGGSSPRVAAVPWFTEGKAANFVTTGERSDPLLFLLLGAKLQDRSQVERIVDTHDDSGGGAAPADLLHGDGVGQVIQAGTT